MPVVWTMIWKTNIIAMLMGFDYAQPPTKIYSQNLSFHSLPQSPLFFVFLNIILKVV
jgi:hypothetical protein